MQRPQPEWPRRMWPGALQQRRGLKLCPGDAILLGRSANVIVAFDGRNDGYLCWRTFDDSEVIDCTQTVLIPLPKAHLADRIAESELPYFPDLPSLDHTGKISKNTLPGSSADGKLLDSRAGQGYDAPQPRGESECDDSEPCTEVQSPNSPRVEGWNPFSSPDDAFGNVYGAMTRECVSDDEAVKQCRFRAALRSLARPLGALRSWVRSLDFSLQLPDQNQHWWELDVETDAAAEDAAVSATPEAKRSNSSPQPSGSNGEDKKDISIIIQIVKPPSWHEVQSIAHRMPVVFDERGVKETMTVKMNRWDGFVDRQKEKLDNEVREMQAARAHDLERDDCDLEEPESEQPPLEDDVIELQSLIERMGDWKDLSRYSGKSISMASTWRGNEMKIHVMGFAEKDDGSGVDFMRLSYKKSIEVRKINAAEGSGPSLESVLSSCSDVRARADESTTKAVEAHWIGLLKQPDIAKFAIALAFRDALERDGVHLEFCDARLDASDDLNRLGQ